MDHAQARHLCKPLSKKHSLEVMWVCTGMQVAPHTLHLPSAASGLQLELPLSLTVLNIAEFLQPPEHPGAGAQELQEKPGVSMPFEVLQATQEQ